MTGGRVLRRPCCCHLLEAKAKTLSPVRAYWPRVRRAVAPGKPLFSGANRRNFNLALKETMDIPAVPDAEHRIARTLFGEANHRS